MVEWQFLIRGCLAGGNFEFSWLAVTAFYGTSSAAVDAHTVRDEKVPKRARPSCCKLCCSPLFDALYAETVVVKLPPSDKPAFGCSDFALHRLFLPHLTLPPNMPAVSITIHVVIVSVGVKPPRRIPV